MLSKRSLFSVLLFSLAQAESASQNKSVSLSFGPLSTHSTFDTSPLNPRGQLFGDNVNDQTAVLAFAKWYIEHILHHPEDSWRVTENRILQDPSTGVWRVDFKQVARNGTIEIVNGNLSLNILNGQVISYGDSFYRGPQPDLSATNCGSDMPIGYPSPFECPDYTIQSYCSTLSEVTRQVWMQENPKWVEWYNQFHRQPRGKKAQDKPCERQERCQASIERALEKCIQEHTTDPAMTSWLRKAWVWWRRDVLKDDSTDVHGYIPSECASLRTKIPLDFSVPAPFKVADSYDEDTCSWIFTTNFTTTSAHLYTIRQFHCEIFPRTDLFWRWRPHDYSASQVDFRRTFDIMQLIQEDESELMETEGIMNPAIAALSLVVWLPHEETAFNWDAVDSAQSVLSKIVSRRRPGGGGYDFELKNVPSADGPVNVTLVYVQTPRRKSHEPFLIDDDDEDSETRPTSSLILAWKLPITFKNGRKFEGYVQAERGGLVRLLHLSVLPEQLQSLPSLPPPDALESMGKEVEQSCFGWGESAAIRAGVKEFLQNGGLGSDGGKTEPSLRRGAATKPLTYRSLDAPLYWGSERMANVYAEILGSVHRSILNHNGDDYIVSDDKTSSDPNHAEDATEMPKETILSSLIPSSLALLPCNPTFIMARDALIRAEQVVLGGKYACVMWKGFAGKGLGINAQAAAERTWTPWGGGKRKDGFDVPEECGSARKEGERRDEVNNRRDEL
ncbi:Fungalysin/Thermolysin Extracellular metalloproteinase 5 [Tulasnella sp. 424]|nr:Fungalysin/Thermolysin Extracellular metalloproteinase 5 [Tulasnella sp. 424]KAG8975414.1 Fungalysin/Thermolysin Extracellular metalloproteinase 5 [Tulasnella sp. 425]